VQVLGNKRGKRQMLPHGSIFTPSPSISRIPRLMGLGRPTGKFRFLGPMVGRSHLLQSPITDLQLLQASYTPGATCKLPLAAPTSPPAPLPQHLIVPARECQVSAGPWLVHDTVADRPSGQNGSSAGWIEKRIIAVQVTMQALRSICCCCFAIARTN
jgi:hypothetical protein